MYATLEELQKAYKGARLGESLQLDNDTTHVYAGPDDDAECVFEMHPAELLEQALNLLHIPWEHV
jgi:hypothetical protein